MAVICCDRRDRRIIEGGLRILVFGFVSQDLDAGVGNFRVAGIHFALEVVGALGEIENLWRTLSESVNESGAGSAGSESWFSLSVGTVGALSVLATVTS